MKLFMVPLWILLLGGVHTHVSTYNHHYSIVQKPATTTVTTTATVTAPPKTAATQTTTTPSATVPATDFATQVEAQVFALVNVERQKAGLPALKLDTKLADIARAHSADMAANNYFEHTNLQGCSSSCRLTNAGYAWRSMGENIYMMSGYTLSADATANMVVQGWMNSPGHKANIMNTSFVNEGIGVVKVGTKVYATEDFALPR